MAMIDMAKKIGEQMGKSLIKEKMKKYSKGEEEMKAVIPQFSKEEEPAMPLNEKKSDAEIMMSKEESKKAWDEKQNEIKSKKKKMIYKQVEPGKVEKVEVRED